MSERTEEDTVSLVVENRIAWVSYNRPEKRNCMSPALNRQMLRVLESVEFREDVGVVVLTGEGSAFSAGMDLKEYFRENEEKGLGATRAAQREAYGWWDRLRWLEKPTIAMVNGWCFGGAYGPLFACDLAVAAQEAQFGLSEINWGILPGGGQQGDRRADRFPQRHVSRDDGREHRRQEGRRMGPGQRGGPARPVEGAGDGHRRGAAGQERPCPARHQMGHPPRARDDL
jgi:enoyl-CoA hydratase/carnithine racemase